MQRIWLTMLLLCGMLSVKAQNTPYNNSDYNAVYYYIINFQDVKGFFQKKLKFFRGLPKNTKSVLLTYFSLCGILKAINRSIL